jgi:hypothetical protein
MHKYEKWSKCITAFVSCFKFATVCLETTHLFAEAGLAAPHAHGGDDGPDMALPILTVVTTSAALLGSVGHLCNWLAARAYSDELKQHLDHNFVPIVSSSSVIQIRDEVGVEWLIERPLIVHRCVRGSCRESARRRRIWRELLEHQERREWHRGSRSVRSIHVHCHVRRDHGCPSFSGVSFRREHNGGHLAGDRGMRRHNGRVGGLGCRSCSRTGVHGHWLGSRWALHFREHVDR